MAALAAVSTTFAQSAVTLSGNLSMGYLKSTTRTFATTGPTQTTLMGPVDVFNSNRITLTVVEDLGQGLKVTGVIDNRLDQGNAARSNGDMFVKVDGGFGTVQIGQYTFASHSAYNAGASRTVSALATSAQTMNASVIQYVTPSFSGLTVAVGFNLNTTANNALSAASNPGISNGENGYGLKVNYAAGPITAQLSHTVAPTSTNASTAIKTTGFGATYDMGAAKVFFNTTDVKAGDAFVGSTTYTASAATLGRNARTGYALSVTVPMGAATFKAGVLNHSDDTNLSIIDRTMFGVDYALSKRTSLTAEFAKDKSAVTGAFRTNNAFVGVNHTF